MPLLTKTYTCFYPTELGALNDFHETYQTFPYNPLQYGIDCADTTSIGTPNVTGSSQATNSLAYVSNEQTSYMNDPAPSRPIPFGRFASSPASCRPPLPLFERRQIRPLFRPCGSYPSRFFYAAVPFACP